MYLRLRKRRKPLDNNRQSDFTPLTPEDTTGGTTPAEPAADHRREPDATHSDDAEDQPKDPRAPPERGASSERPKRPQD